MCDSIVNYLMLNYHTVFLQKGSNIVKANVYYLIENEHILHYSGDINKLIKYTINTTNAKIYFNNTLVWIQNTNEYYR